MTRATVPAGPSSVGMVIRDASVTWWALAGTAAAGLAGTALALADWYTAYAVLFALLAAGGAAGYTVASGRRARRVLGGTMLLGLSQVLVVAIPAWDSGPLRSGAVIALLVLPAFRLPEIRELLRTGWTPRFGGWPLQLVPVALAISAGGVAAYLSEPPMDPAGGERAAAAGAGGTAALLAVAVATAVVQEIVLRGLLVPEPPVWWGGTAQGDQNLHTLAGGLPTVAIAGALVSGTASAAVSALSGSLALALWAAALGTAAGLFRAASGALSGVLAAHVVLAVSVVAIARL